MKKYFISFALLALSLSHAPAQAGFIGVDAMGGMNYTTWFVNPTTATTISPGVGFLGGAMINFNPFSLITIQAGGFYATRTINGVNGTTNFSQNWGNFQIPFMVRFNPIPFISLGLGGFYQIVLGNVNVATTPSGGPTSTNSLAPSVVGLSTSSMGLMASVAGRFTLPVVGLSVLGQVNYLFGLTNDTTTAGMFAGQRDLQFMAGVGYEFL